MAMAGATSRTPLPKEKTAAASARHAIHNQQIDQSIELRRGNSLQALVSFLIVDGVINAERVHLRAFLPQPQFADALPGMA